MKYIVNIYMENTTQDQTQITITDLDLLRNIVDLASSRGAFRAAELTQVGAVYDKLTTFLDAVIAQVKAQEEANQSADEPADTETQGE
jgi:hypothetical protein